MTIPVGYGQATFIFNGAGVPTGAAVTTGFGNPGNDSASTIADFFRAQWVGQIMDYLTEDVGLEEVQVKLGPDATGATAVSTAGTPGTITNASAAPNTSFLVSKNTSLGGRRGRGRMYVPGVDETSVSESGAISGTLRDDLQGGFDGFEAAASTADYTLVVLHDPATIWELVDGQPRRVEDPGAPAAPAPTVITSLTVSAVVATQRRRLRR